TGIPMKIVVLFYNLGGYHLARLQAFHKACLDRQWQLFAIQIAESTAEHPWGSVPLPDYVVTLESFQHGASPGLTDDSRRALVQTLDQQQADVVVIPGWGFDFARLALQWCRKNQRPAVLMSESKADDAPRSWWKELVKRLGYIRHFSSAIVGGEKHQQYLLQLGMPADRIFTGYDVVDNDFFANRVDGLRQTDSIEACPEKRENIPPPSRKKAFSARRPTTGSSGSLPHWL
ncbi:MAG TPA: hypothetical protein PK008_12225, partial [Aminivibrio sp.]